MLNKPPNGPPIKIETTTLPDGTIVEEMPITFPPPKGGLGSKMEVHDTAMPVGGEVQPTEGIVEARPLFECHTRPTMGLGIMGLGMMEGSEVLEYEDLIRDHESGAEGGGVQEGDEASSADFPPKELDDITETHFNEWLSGKDDITAADTALFNEWLTEILGDEPGAEGWKLAEEMGVGGGEEGKEENEEALPPFNGLGEGGAWFEG
ncbi:MAG: hypothetical protein Q9218_006105 [Villophora microphyllina]